MANAAGVAVASDAKCDPASMGKYAALALPGGLDHIVISKKDAGQNACIRLQLDYPSNFSQYSIQSPFQWGVATILVSGNAADCDNITMQPTGDKAWAKSASGSIGWAISKGMLYPCDIDIDVSLTLDSPPPGIAKNQVMKAQMITVKGGCM